jgi:phytoene/squalene synthetase
MRVKPDYKVNHIFNHLPDTKQFNSSFNHWFGGIFFYPIRREILFGAYAYFRWLDDVLDNKDVSTEESINILARESFFISSLYENKSPQSKCIEEKYISFVICKDLLDNNGFRVIIDGFMSALSWDIKRKHRIPTQQELDEYSLRLGRSYYQCLVFGLDFHPSDKCFKDVGEICGVAAHLAHILRDFFFDLSIGYVNISQEDVTKYHIDLSLKNPELRQNLKPWSRDVIFKSTDMFKKGMKSINKIPSFKARLAISLMCTRYFLILQKAKIFWGYWNG